MHNLGVLLIAQPLTLHHVRQVQEVQSRRLQDSQAVRAASLLPVDLASVVAGIEDGRLNDVDAIDEEILSVSRGAADRLAEAQDTGDDNCLMLCRGMQGRIACCLCSGLHSEPDDC